MNSSFYGGYFGLLFTKYDGVEHPNAITFQLQYFKLLHSSYYKLLEFNPFSRVLFINTIFPADQGARKRSHVGVSLLYIGMFQIGRAHV